MDDDYKNTSVSDVSQEASYPQSVALMKCPHCKADIEVGSMYCEYCGGKIEDSPSPAPTYSPPSTYSNVSPVSPQANTTSAPLGTVSLILSIVGLVVLLLVFLLPEDMDEDLDMLIGLVVIGGIAASIVGMVLGISGLKKIADNRRAYSGVPKLTVGKILGLVGIISWGVLMTVGFFFIFATEGLEGFL